MYRERHFPENLSDPSAATQVLSSLMFTADRYLSAFCQIYQDICQQVGAMKGFNTRLILSHLILIEGY